MGNSYSQNPYNPSYGRKTFLNRIQDKVDRKIAKYAERSLQKPNDHCNKIKLDSLLEIKKMMPSTTIANPQQSYQRQSQTTLRNPSVSIHNIQHEEKFCVCVYCQERVASSSYRNHMNACAQIFEATNASLVQNYNTNIRTDEGNPSLLLAICDYCSQEVFLEHYNYHLSRCELNPKNLNRSQRQEEKDTETAQTRECAICLQTMEDDSHTRFLACAHQFHSNCIEDWSRKRKTCPVCMNDFS